MLDKGRPWPLGAQVVPGGVNFAVHAPHASSVELCLFDEAGEVEQARLPLRARSGAVWHGLLPGATAGLVYGLRAHGPWAPEHGDRFSPHKLLLDPWAREIVGRFEHRDEHHASHPADNARWALKARVVQDAYDWRDDRPPHLAPSDLVVLELHVKGFTMRHPQVPEALRGTYAGLASVPARMGSWAKAWKKGASCSKPVSPRASTGARSKRKPSTWYSCTQWRRLSSTSRMAPGRRMSSVLPHPVKFS